MHRRKENANGMLESPEGRRPPAPPQGERAAFRGQRGFARRCPSSVRRDEIVITPSVRLPPATTALTGMLFGSVPALASARVDVQEQLKEGGRNATNGGRHSRMPSVLVVSQVTLM
jgi:hypothetical protein